MSKATRERARQSKQSSYPKYFAIVGIIAVLAVAGVLTKTFIGWSSKASPDVAAAGQPDGAATTTANPAAHGRKLLFFMNPDGYPCQTQLGILNSVADSLSKVAQVVYIKTTEPGDMQKFEEYGIRGLPSLVIADATGRELSRFAPGIQSGEAVLAALTR
jgi:thioredoxin 1